MHMGSKQLSYRATIHLVIAMCHKERVSISINVTRTLLVTLH